MPDFQKGVDKSEYAQSSISDLLLHTSSRSVLSYFQLGRIGVSGAISNSYSHLEWLLWQLVATSHYSSQMSSVLAR